jgi:hypothetical protein
MCAALLKRTENARCVGLAVPGYTRNHGDPRRATSGAVSPLGGVSWRLRDTGLSGCRDGLGQRHRDFAVFNAEGDPPNPLHRRPLKTGAHGVEPAQEPLADESEKQAAGGCSESLPGHLICFWQAACVSVVDGLDCMVLLSHAMRVPGLKSH